MCCHAVGEEHDAELAHHHVERCLLDRQMQGVGLLEDDTRAAEPGGGAIEHGLIEVGRQHFGLRTSLDQGCGEHSGSCRRLHDALRTELGNPGGQRGCGNGEDHGDHQPVVDLGNRPDEAPVTLALRLMPVHDRTVRRLVPRRLLAERGAVAR